MPRLKVCGITDATFAVEAARRGADYLGFVFAEGSPRRVSPDFARSVVKAVSGPRFVGVFAGLTPDEVLRIAEGVALDVVQLHGDYDAKAVAMLKQHGFEVWRLDGGGGSAGEDATLVDGSDGKRHGGTGRIADWSRVAELKRSGRRVVLAGGLSAANIGSAAATGADVLDVNSSIETSPGNKSVERLDELVRKLVYYCS